MAEKEKYIAQYRKPLGIDNPPLNLPKANSPEEVFLTESEAKVVRGIVPDIKLVKAKDKSKKEPVKEAVEEPEQEEEVQAEEAGEEEEANQTQDGTSEEQAGPSLLEDDEDFPAADKLLENEISTVEEVVERLDSLTDISGIGNKTADSIKEYIQKNYAQLLSEDE